MPVKVLLVDDNPLVLELMHKGLQSHAEVEARQDAVSALMSAFDSPPDLVIADYRMTGIDGVRLLQELRGKPQTQKVPFVIVATKADVDERLQPIAEEVEDFFIKPFFVRDFVKRAKRIIDRLQIEKMQREASAGAGMNGRLSEMGIMDLFPTLEQGQKTCALVITGPDERETATIYFVEGQIHHAVMGDLKGDAVINHIVHWQDGTFRIDFDGRSSERTISTGTQSLLMEALRLLDEENR